MTDSTDLSPFSDEKLRALAGVAAAAALRSHNALWDAAMAAAAAGASWEELLQAVDIGAQTAQDAVRSESLPTVREVWARQGAQERWQLTSGG